MKYEFFWKMVKQMATLTDYALFCNTIAKKFNKLWENYKDLSFTECVEKLTVWLITFSKLYRSLYQKQILYAQHDVIRSGLDCSCSACRLDDDTLTILLGRLVYHGLTILLGRLVYLVLSLFWRTFLDIECNFSVCGYIQCVKSKTFSYNIKIKFQPFFIWWNRTWGLPKCQNNSTK